MKQAEIEYKAKIDVANQKQNKIKDETSNTARELQVGADLPVKGRPGWVFYSKNHKVLCKLSLKTHFLRNRWLTSMRSSVRRDLIISPFNIPFWFRTPVPYNRSENQQKVIRFVPGVQGAPWVRDIQNFVDRVRGSLIRPDKNIFLAWPSVSRVYAWWNVSRGNSLQNFRIYSKRSKSSSFIKIIR